VKNSLDTEKQHRPGEKIDVGKASEIEGSTVRPPCAAGNEE
jgi:hypothetical protein